MFSLGKVVVVYLVGTVQAPSVPKLHQGIAPYRPSPGGVAGSANDNNTCTLHFYNVGLRHDRGARRPAARARRSKRCSAIMSPHAHASSTMSSHHICFILGSVCCFTLVVCDVQSVFLEVLYTQGFVCACSSVLRKVLLCCLAAMRTGATQMEEALATAKQGGVMMPPAIKRSLRFMVLSVYRAEGLPSCDPSRYKAVHNTDTFK